MTCERNKSMEGTIELWTEQNMSWKEHSSCERNKICYERNKRCYERNIRVVNGTTVWREHTSYERNKDRKSKEKPMEESTHPSWTRACSCWRFWSWSSHLVLVVCGSITAVFKWKEKWIWKEHGRNILDGIIKNRSAPFWTLWSLVFSLLALLEIRRYSDLFPNLAYKSGENNAGKFYYNYHGVSQKWEKGPDIRWSRSFVAQKVAGKLMLRMLRFSRPCLHKVQPMDLYGWKGYRSRPAWSSGMAPNDTLLTERRQFPRRKEHF